MKNTIRTIFLCVMILALGAGLASAEKNAPQPIGLFATITSHRTTKDNGVTLLNQYWTEIRRVDDEPRRFPQLAKAIDEYSRAEQQRARKQHDKIALEAREHFKEQPQYFNGYYLANRLIFNRADSLVLSFTEMPSDYLGGAHGMYGKIGVNFDTATGKKLSLSDVFADAEKTAEVVTERIFAQYAEESLFEPKEKILEYIVEEKASWSLDNDGVTFYFNPYAIAPYAAGILTAKVYFDFDKSIFKEKYRQQPMAFVTNFDGDILAELNGQMTPIRMTVNDEKLKVTVGAEELVADGNRKIPMGMFIKLADGKHFLWIDNENTDTGVREILVYVLEPNLRYVGTIKRTFVDPTSNEYEQRRLWMTNPYGFMLYKNVTLPGEDKTDIGSVGENGLLLFG